MWGHAENYENIQGIMFHDLKAIPITQGFQKHASEKNA